MDQSLKYIIVDIGTEAAQFQEKKEYINGIFVAVGAGRGASSIDSRTVWSITKRLFWLLVLQLFKGKIILEVYFSTENNGCHANKITDTTARVYVVIVVCIIRIKRQIYVLFIYKM